MFDVYIELSQAQFLAGVSFNKGPTPALGDTAYFFINDFPQTDALHLRGFEVRRQMKLDTTYLKENENTLGCLLLRNHVPMALGYSAFDLTLDIVNNLKMRTVRHHFSVKPIFVLKQLASTRLATIINNAKDLQTFRMAVSVSDQGAMVVSIAKSAIAAVGGVPGDTIHVLANGENQVVTGTIGDVNVHENGPVESGTVFIPVDTQWISVGDNTVTAVLVHTPTEGHFAQGTMNVVAFSEFRFDLPSEQIRDLREHEADHVSDAHDFSTSAHLQPLSKFAGRSTVVVPERQGSHLKLYGKGA